MSDYQRVIDDIRYVLQADTIELTDNLRGCADIYASLCREVNTRLRRCEEFLKQNLRSEAIHLAEASPNLVELISILDFPERDQWISVVELYELPRPPALLLDIASALNLAYSELEPMKVLMGQHRLLALSHAPLWSRLSVLRQLATVDSAAVYWEDDIAQIEEARLKELSQDARQAALKEDLPQLESILKEVNSSDWNTPPSDALKREIKNRAAQTKVSLARKEMGRIATQLDLAFNAMDFEAGYALVSLWEKTAPIARLPEDDPLHSQAEPAIGWVKDQQELQRQDLAFEKSVHVLTQGLDRDDATASELERLGHAVQLFNRGMPEILATRYRNRLSHLNMAARRKRLLHVGSAVTVVVVLIGAIATFSFFSLRTKKVNDLAASVEALTKQYEFDSAQKIVDANPGYSGIGRWLEAVQQLAAARKEEQDRLLKFADNVKRAKEATQSVTADAAIREATSLARTEEEKLECKRLADLRKDQESQAQMDRDKAFRDKTKEISEELQALDKLVVESPEDPRLPQRLSDVQNEIKDLRSNRDSVSPVLVTQLELLEGRLNTITDQSQIARKKLGIFKTLDELSAIARNHTDQERRYQAYLKQLGEFAVTFPDDVCTKSFNQVMNSKRDLQILRWLATASKWKTPLPDLPADYLQRIRACEECRKEVTNSPLDETIRRYHELLTARTIRTGTTATMKYSLKTQLSDLYSPATLPKSFIVKLTDQKTPFYLPEAIELKGKNEQERAYFQALSYPGGPTDRVGIDVFELATRDVPEAPYVRLAEDLRRQMEHVNTNQWEGQVAGLISRIKSSNSVDPFLRYSLILSTLELGAKGSPVLDDAIKQSSIKFPDPRFGITQPWMDPRDAETTSAREEAEELMTRLPNLEGIDAKAEAHKSAIIEQLSKGYEAVGWLHKGASEKWTLRIPGANGINGDILVTGLSSGGGPVWKKIGHVSKGVVTPEADLAQSGAVSGDLVFLETPMLVPTAVANK